MAVSGTHSVHCTRFAFVYVTSWKLRTLTVESGTKRMDSSDKAGNQHRNPLEA